jgi:isoquinoline 1-oxidoreductase beta subunit
MFSPRRRVLLKLGTAAAGGLVLGVYLPGTSRAAAPGKGTVLPPNAFIRIAPDDSITMIVHKAEMGQGAYTAIPMLLAEELEVDLARIKIEFAPVADVYKHPQWGVQGTGGSTSVRTSDEPLRRTAATAREMLRAAAARRWGVDAAECEARDGRIVHRGSGREATYGALAEDAARETAPADVRIKEPAEFRLLGTSPARLDTPAKVTGAAQFSVDVAVPGMLTAVVARPPVFGAKLKRFDATAAKAVPGVREVVSIAAGVAVAADSFHAATRGREALEIEWDEGPNAGLSTPALWRKYADVAKRAGAIAHEQGDVGKVERAGAKSVEAVYELPFLAHATMEPLNAVADVRQDRCEIWAGTQNPEIERDAAAEITGLPPQAIRVHSTFLGGGFGRRGNVRCDSTRPAVELSKAIGRPVKVMMTREDDTRAGYYRPMHYSSLSAVLDADGLPVAWTHHLVGGSLWGSLGMMDSPGIDRTSVEGAAPIAYAIPNQRVEYHVVDDGVPILWWRSVGHTFTAFVVESFVDELAAAAGQDPVEYRRRLLPEGARERGVLDLAAREAGWGERLPAGRGRGVAVHKSFGSYCAQIAEVSVSQDGRPRVHRVVCAIDCGRAYHPDNVRAQMEGGLIYGLSAALYGKITLKDGRVEQSNFHDYPMVRMADAPEIEVHILDSGEALGGIGEPGTPPIAPAVCNAIFAATGKRVRNLPIDPGALRQA